MDNPEGRSAQLNPSSCRDVVLSTFSDESQELGWRQSGWVMATRMHERPAQEAREQGLHQEYERFREEQLRSAQALQQLREELQQQDLEQEGKRPRALVQERPQPKEREHEELEQESERQKLRRRQRQKEKERARQQYSHVMLQDPVLEPHRQRFRAQEEQRLYEEMKRRDEEVKRQRQLQEQEQQRFMVWERQQLEQRARAALGATVFVGAVSIALTSLIGPSAFIAVPALAAMFIFHEGLPGRPASRASVSDGITVTSSTPRVTGAATAATSNSDDTASWFIHKQWDVYPDLPDLGAIVEPAAYFQQLEDIQTRVVEASCLNEILIHDPSDPRKLSFMPSNLLQDVTERSPKRMAEVALAIIQILQESEFCNGHVSFLAEDSLRRNTVKAVEISISELKILLLWIKDYWISSIPWRFMTIFEDLDIQLDAEDPVETCFSLCCFITLGLVSFAGSHCSSLDELFGSMYVECVAFENLKMFMRGGDTASINFHRRELSCLGGYIGGPLWVFGLRDSVAPAALSISISAFTTLWGPVLAVPAGDNFKELLALKVEGGVVYRVPLHQSKQPTLLLGDEILMHFTKLEHWGRPILKDGTPADGTAYCSPNSETLPGIMMPFSASARLLIGHPDSPQSSRQGLESCSRRGATINSPLLNVNERCLTDAKCFGRRHANSFFPSDTYEAHYVPEQLQASINAAQYIGGGLGKVWRKRPASTWKSALSLYCAGFFQKKAHVECILELKLGLELSICTGNARRVTLWDALNLAYPKAAQFLQAARSESKLPAISPYINQLAKTGYNENNRFQLRWPFEEGFPYDVDLTDKLPDWINMMKETRISACFGVMSSKCLTYTDRDKFARPHQRVTQNCHDQAADFGRSFLETTINLHPESHPKLPLRPGTRIRLQDGFLEMRNTTLAFHSGSSIWTRLHELSARGFEGHRRNVHHELLDLQRASNYFFRVCIMDYSASQGHGENSTASVPALRAWKTANEEASVAYYLRPRTLTDSHEASPGRERDDNVDLLAPTVLALQT